MKPLMLLIAACMTAAALFCAAGPAAAHGEKHAKTVFTKHFQQTLFDATEKALFSIEVLLDDSEFEIGRNTVGIIVHDAEDEDVEKAELGIALKGLEDGQVLTGPFSIKGTLPGLYIVSGLDLKKPGRWELSISVRKDAKEDRVKFILPDALKERVSKGRYSP
ncbi:MAG: hypothetical protein OHK006_08230 [Thermodesulfovibrionales bacterium]